MRKEKRRISPKNNGITLIALVITIIVLLILAGVTLVALSGNNGILQRATQAQSEQADATVKEAIALAWSEYQIEINDTTGTVVENKTKIASTEQVTIQGQEENYLATPSMSFFAFLKDEKGYIDENGVVNVKALTGETLSKGNGVDGVDVYVIEQQENAYILKYYGENGEETILWEINTDNNVSTYPEATPESEFTVVSGGKYNGNYGIKQTDIVIIGLENQTNYHSTYYLPEGTSGEIVIPKTIKDTTVGALIANKGFFKNCYDLKRIVIPNSVTYMSEDIFSGTSNLEEISFPEGINPSLQISQNKWGARDGVKILVENEEI